MLTSIADFIHYFASVRRRTIHFIEAVPAGLLDWKPAEGELSVTELIRHITAAEIMFVTAVVEQRLYYQGHTPTDQSLAELVAELNAHHQHMMTMLATMPDAVLNEHRINLEGAPIRVWRWLLAMIEHEIHHRSQLAMYLTLNGITPPHIYGLGVEDVIARATG